MRKISCFIAFALIFAVFIMSVSSVSANSYVEDIYFIVPNTVYTTNERIEFKGFLYQTNYSSNGSLVTGSTALANTIVNLTILYQNKSYISNYTLTTDVNGTFYSKSNFYPSGVEINASSAAGYYYIRAQHKDSNNVSWFSEVEINVVNKSIDYLKVGPNKAVYFMSESMMIYVEAQQIIGDSILYIANVSVNGTIRNSTESILSSFNCTTGTNGKCSVTKTAPSTTGNYIIELNNYKAYSSFSVVPFSFSVYMKDELGKSLKNVFALGEQARVEVKIPNATTGELYNFSGYIRNSSGSTIKLINTTEMSINNSFANSFLFTIDSLTFAYGAYTAFVNVSKLGDGSIISSTSFEVKDWVLSINKRDSSSGFEYEYSAFPNKTVYMELYPTFRSNGSVIPNISSASFEVNIKDKLNNVLSSVNATWNASCGKEGCYEIAFNTSGSVGSYVIYATLSYNGGIQSASKTINVIEGVMSAQSTNKEGSLKELFGTNEFVYISFTAYNLSDPLFNLSNAEVFSVSYMNGSEFSYSEVSNFSLVNATNSVYEWAWNSSLQRLKLDVPTAGGVYVVTLFGNNRSLGTTAKFIVNPYDACLSTKDTAGQVTSGYYYVWQFKTTDTVYFEIKLTQANNPLGKATASNTSGNGSGSNGVGSQCNVDTSTKQAVTNASLSIIEIKNSESGAVQSINTTDSICQSSDNSGGYTCTVKPYSKWEGGGNIVKFSVIGQDGTTDIVYGRFEARAFYMYGYSANYQNNPSSNISLTVQLYEAGRGWWGSSGGLGGTVTLKKIEYQGRDGEWIWPPVDSGYNVSNISATITSGSGTLAVPVSAAVGGVWKTGYYRVILQGTTSAGDTDYGYAWFAVKLWDVYGQPIDCGGTTCSYKSYFNSRENVTLYVKISKAGAYNYNYAGGEYIMGNVSVSVLKIQNCKTWPCKELNSSEFSANTIVLNASNPWYWNANYSSQNQSIIQINTTSGSWGTGYYSVVLNVNGTDTGNAWFNTIAFYVDIQPTDINGTNYVYSIKNSKPMYFNVSTVKSYKWGYYSGSNYIKYNASDYINATFDSAVLRTYNQSSYQSITYSYPGDINVSPNNVSGNGLMNVSFKNGNWPSGYYWGELTMKNSLNETSSGYLWFSVQPFRVSITNNNYNLDSEQCVNASIDIYDPSWYSSSRLYGNYSITSIYEDVWNGGTQSRTLYTNYTSTAFNATANITVCPNSDTNSWGTGSWGGYHYLNVMVRDNSDNSSQVGWLYFRAVPFSISWGSVGGGNSKLTSQSVSVPVTLTKYSTAANASGNLTRIHQWRYDNGRSTDESYVFSVGSCYSNVSSKCMINGSGNVTVYPPANGWRIGYNYLYTEWTKYNDASSMVSDYNGIYIDGRETYNGYYSNVDANGNYQYNFANNVNLTLKLYVRDSSYNPADINVSAVYYAAPDNTCWSEWCRNYVSAGWSIVGGGSNTSSGNAIIRIHKPTGTTWALGDYAIKVAISGANGANTITGGMVRVADTTAPNVSISYPVINQSLNDVRTFAINFTTTKNADCRLQIMDYTTFYGQGNCGNSTNSTNSSSATLSEICNSTYRFNSTRFYWEYTSKDYRSVYSGSWSSYWSYSGMTGLSTGGTTHSYTYNTTDKYTGVEMTAQDYVISAQCFDSFWNAGTAYLAIKLNTTSTNTTLTYPLVTINSPVNGRYYNMGNTTINISSNKAGNCSYSIWPQSSVGMSTNDNMSFIATNSSIVDGNYSLRANCSDSAGNVNSSVYSNFTIDTTFPLLSYAGGTPINNSNSTVHSIFVNVSITDLNANLSRFVLYNSTTIINTTTYTYHPVLEYFSLVNWSVPLHGYYNYNVSVYDKAGNANYTIARNINITAS